MRIAGELAVAVHRAEEEAEDDLAHAVAGGLVALLYLFEADAFDELADHHAFARETRDDVGDEDERVSAEDAGERALVARLELVVELLDHAHANLVPDRLGVEAGSDAAHQAQDDAEVLHGGA